ncbi:MAG: hypothetical protein IK118_06590 [Clostridia bacterium]|nr:hypothetical protein [Clostridia bacterium]
MADNRKTEQRGRRQTIRYHAGDGRLYLSDSRSVFTDPRADGGTRTEQYVVLGNTAAAPLRAEPAYTEPAETEPVKKQPSAPRRQRKPFNPVEWFREGLKQRYFKRNLYLFGAAALATLLAMASLLLGLSANYTKTINQIASVREETEMRRQENEALKTQIELMFSKREVEAYAENTLHMVKSTVFNTVSITISANRIPAVPGSAAKSPQIEQLPAAFGDVSGETPDLPQTADGAQSALPVQALSVDAEG